MNIWQIRTGITVIALVFSSIVMPVPSVQAADAPAVIPLPDANATTAAEMKKYKEAIPGTEAAFEMIPIPAGKFTMGSPASEANRRADEGPQHEVTIEPFWMEVHETTWDEYEVFMINLDIHRREVLKIEPTPLDKFADAIARPTKPYTDMSFGMGKANYPAISMTHFAARMYCKWLSLKTGRYYRLPTEAEWEYACRAGSKTAYNFGDEPKKLDDQAWYKENSDEAYHKVKQKKPNAFGLYDMHGNVSEWVLDQYAKDYYETSAKGKTGSTINPPLQEFPHAARGGAWDDDPEECRSAARKVSSKAWKQQDPQIPQSVWYLTDAQFVGMRVVRPLKEPTAEEKKKIWDVGLDQVVIPKR